ncbi:MAG: GNAT family N-acetyltransferase [Anaerolineae bacterium]|nr:GNAT family N-acetyltransferase [Anaerolineae bacterium]
MTTVAAIGVPTGVCTGIRPFNPFRDLPQVTRLLAQVFGPELSVESSSTARLVRWMRRFPSLGWLWMGFDAWFDGNLGGYVWVCGDKLVGNANIAPVGVTGRQWVLSNVAVEEGSRGRGIGRQLVEASLRYAWQRGADQVLLQVWQSNRPALRLYESFGFRLSGRLWRLGLEPGRRLRPPVARSDERLAWRRVRGGDLEALKGMVAAMLPHKLRLLRPSPVSAFQEGLWQRLRRILAGSVTGTVPMRRVLLRDGRVVGGLALTPVEKERARLTVVLMPDPSEDTAAAVVSQVTTLTADPTLDLLVDLPESLDRLRVALVQVGFEERDALLQMSLERPYRAEWDLAV